MNSRIAILMLVVAGILGFGAATAQETEPSTEERITNLEKQVGWLNYKVRSGSLVLFLFGGFCALWAQTTRRNPWLWFFLGMFFNVITVLVLLYKNSKQRRE